MFDSHCHIHEPRFQGAEAAIARARAAGVRGFLLAGVGPELWPVEERLAAAHPDVVVSLGIHPQLVAELDDEECDGAVRRLAERLASARPPVVAVGEIGLDAHDGRKGTLDRQERIFRAQLALARDGDLPVSLHVLRAHGRALAILRRDGVPRAGGVVHSYSGGAELVRDYLAIGLDLSFAGPVANPAAHRIRAAALAVPRERLLVETDAPDQTPLGRQPAPNEPAFLVAIVEALARLRGEGEEQIAEATDANARRLFRIGSLREKADGNR
nr:putative deoxyribonuclease YcfH [uncultured bacterium]